MHKVAILGTVLNVVGWLGVTATQKSGPCDGKFTLDGGLVVILALSFGHSVGFTFYNTAQAVMVSMYADKAEQGKWQGRSTSIQAIAGFTGPLLGRDGLHGVLPDGIEDGVTFCWEVVQADLRMLSQLLTGCTAEHICAWLHSVIEKLWAEQHQGLATAADRQRWEQNFAMVHTAAANADVARAEAVKRPTGAVRPLLHRIVDEDPSVMREGLLPQLLVPVDQPSFEALLDQVTALLAARSRQAQTRR